VFFVSGKGTSITHLKNTLENHRRGMTSVAKMHLVKTDQALLVLKYDHARTETEFDCRSCLCFLARDTSQQRK